MNDTEKLTSYQNPRQQSVDMWTAIILIFVNVAYIGYALYTIVRLGYFDWGGAAFLGVYVIALLGTLAGMFYIRKGKYTRGAWFLLEANLFPLVTSSIALKDFGIASIAFLVVYAYVFIVWVMPLDARKYSISNIFFAAIAIILSDFLDFSFQIDSQGIKEIVPIVVLVMAIAFTLLILQHSWRGRIRTKILVGFAVISIIGGTFAFIGSQFAIGGITDNALPSLEALGHVSQAVRSMQS